MTEATRGDRLEGDELEEDAVGVGAGSGVVGGVREESGGTGDGGSLETDEDCTGGGIDMDRRTGVWGVGMGFATGIPGTREGLSVRKRSAATRLLKTANSTHAKTSSEREN